MLFARLAEMWKQLNATSAYIIDTFPIAALDNIRIWRARLYQDKAFRGYIPSKKRYFFGLRLCLLTTVTAEPVEAFLVPGSMSDAEAVQRYAYDLPRAASWRRIGAAPTTRQKTCSLRPRTLSCAQCARPTRSAPYRRGSRTCSSTGERWWRLPAA
ncbi:MAG TPA: hypothetical protein VFQ76_04135 [Longimicrobiaceae bacterium]|nr:hypothetical protein [Longimicrobiaceae bacterium]